MSTISASTTNTTAYKVTADTTGALVLQTGSGPTTAVTVDTSQNVGIGTSSPAQKLDVVGTTNRILWNVDSATFIESTLNAAGVSYVDKVTRANQFIFQTGTTERMRIDTSGNVGIGTSSPTTKLQVNGGAVINGNTAPTSGSGLELLWDGTESVIQSYSRTSSSFQPLWLEGGTYTRFGMGGVEKMRIDTSGNLLVGTTGSNAKLCVEQSGVNWARFVNHTNAGTQYFDTFRYNGTQIGAISGNNTTTTYSTSSDYRLKEDIQPMTGALAKVAQLKPVTYKWKADGSDGEGFIAHELQEVCPQAVVGEKDAVDAEGNPKYQGIDTSFLVATLTAAIQEQQAIITQLQSDVAALKGQA